jgi:uncharacterized protein with HEPN domain
MKDSRKDSLERLNHFVKGIKEIESYTNGISENVFLDNKLISSAVLFQFSVIGEAIVHVDSNILEPYNYPWFKVRSFRNLISHEYFNIKLEAVWEIIIKDLSELKKVVLNILEKEF